MKTIQIQSLRSLLDTGPVDLRPITILVGNNSSGKSTFLRTFPLLRQSSEARTRGPILWYGDLTDFGAYEEATSTFGNQSPISFRFSFYARNTSQVEDGFVLEGEDRIPDGDFLVRIDLDRNTDTNSTFASGFTIQVNEDLLEVATDSTGQITKFSSNGLNCLVKGVDLRVFHSGALIPRVIIRERVKDQNGTERSVLLGRPSIEAIVRPMLEGVLPEDERPAKLLEAIATLKMRSQEELHTSILALAQENLWWREYIKEKSPFDAVLIDLRNALLASVIPTIIDRCNAELKRLFAGITYVAPVRASAQRYYRFQDLAVDEIDPMGENLPAFLQSLSASERLSFEEWSSQHFGFIIKPKFSGGHISLRILETGSDQEYNLADMGFGFSQLVPILTQIWSTVYSRRKSKDAYRRVRNFRLLAIEQPELHLHPKMQARFADLLVSVLKYVSSKKIQLIFVIETHSETLINRLGANIEAKHISEKDVSVLIFNKKSASEPTKVRIAEFSEEGLLNNWPFDFFQPSDLVP